MVSRDGRDATSSHLGGADEDAMSRNVDSPTPRRTRRTMSKVVAAEACDVEADRSADRFVSNNAPCLVSFFVGLSIASAVVAVVPSAFLVGYFVASLRVDPAPTGCPGDGACIGVTTCSNTVRMTCVFSSSDLTATLTPCSSAESIAAARVALDEATFNSLAAFSSFAFAACCFFWMARGVERFR